MEIPTTQLVVFECSHCIRCRFHWLVLVEPMRSSVRRTSAIANVPCAFKPKAPSLKSIKGPPINQGFEFLRIGFELIPEPPIQCMLLKRLFAACVVQTEVRKCERQWKVNSAVVCASVRMKKALNGNYWWCSAVSDVSPILLTTTNYATAMTLNLPACILQLLTRLYPLHRHNLTRGALHASGWAACG